MNLGNKFKKKFIKIDKKKAKIMTSKSKKIIK